MISTIALCADYEFKIRLWDSESNLRRANYISLAYSSTYKIKKKFQLSYWNLQTHKRIVVFQTSLWSRSIVLSVGFAARVQSCSRFPPRQQDYDEELIRLLDVRNQPSECSIQRLWQIFSSGRIIPISGNSSPHPTRVCYRVTELMRDSWKFDIARNFSLFWLRPENSPWMLIYSTLYTRVSWIDPMRVAEHTPCTREDYSSSETLSDIKFHFIAIHFRESADKSRSFF